MNRRVVSFEEQQLKTNLLIAIDCCLKHCCHLIGFGCMRRDEIWNTITKKTHTHTAMMMMEYFDTQSQWMRYFVYTVGKNVNMIKTKNRTTSFQKQSLLLQYFVSIFGLQYILRPINYKVKFVDTKQTQDASFTYTTRIYDGNLI